MLGNIDTNCEKNCPGCPVQRRLAEKAQRVAIGYALNSAGITNVLNDDYRAVPQSDKPEDYASARLVDATDAYEALQHIIGRSAVVARNCQRPTHFEAGKLTLSYCTSTEVPSYLSFGLE